MKKQMLCAALAVAGLAAAAATEKVTLGSLLRDMTDVDANTYLPATRFTTRLWSSYDRRTTTADKPDWFANGDANQFLRSTKLPDGSEEQVMLDAKGPGAIVRFWITVSGDVHKGSIRLYVDDVLQYEDNCLTFVSGGLLCPAPLSDSVSKLSELGQRGHDLYLPIPYAKSCKVTYVRPNGVKGSFYYNVETRTYAEGTAVESLSADVLKREAKAIAAANHALARRLAGADKPADETVRFDGTIAPGESITRDLTRDSGGAVRFLGLTLTGPESETYLRSTVLEMTFDGERTVWVPVGEFFGCGGLYESYTSWFTSCPGTDQLESRWTMPFAKTCRMTLHNFGAKPVQVANSEMAVGPYAWNDARSLHFGACWHSYCDVESRKGPKKMQWDYNFVELTGEGFLTGTTLTLWQPNSRWWGEGDEKVFVDGEVAPSYIGTGSEDYFGYAWCRPQPFSHPFIAQPIGIVSNRRLSANADRRSAVNVRNRALDAIPFTKSIRFDMEMWHWEEEIRLDFAPLATWYARPGVKVNWQPDPEAVKRKVRLECVPTIFVRTVDLPKTARLFENFERLDYGAWKVEGEAFGTGPALGTLPNQNPVEGYVGKRLVNSFTGGDDTFGRLQSPEFEIQDNFLNFLIGGGEYAGETCVNLVVDGKVARTAVGRNNERLEWTAWDLRDLKGKRAFIEIVDRRRGHFGHINADYFYFDVNKR